MEKRISELYNNKSKEERHEDQGMKKERNQRVKYKNSHLEKWNVSDRMSLIYFAGSTSIGGAFRRKYTAPIPTTIIMAEYKNDHVQLLDVEEELECEQQNREIEPDRELIHHTDPKMKKTSTFLERVCQHVSRLEKVRCLKRKKRTRDRLWNNHAIENSSHTENSKLKNESTTAHMILFPTEWLENDGTPNYEERLRRNEECGEPIGWVRNRSRKKKTRERKRENMNTKEKNKKHESRARTSRKTRFQPLKVINQSDIAFPIQELSGSYLQMEIQRERFGVHDESRREKWKKIITKKKKKWRWKNGINESDESTRKSLKIHFVQIFASTNLRKVRLCI